MIAILLKPVLYLLSKLVSLETFVLLRSLLLILLIDGLLLDDEPLWEPIEWSVMQTWVLYIYIFAWAAEVIFSSRYGSYTNRDKVVWIGLYKTYYLLKYWFIFNMIAVTVFVTMPFYFEVTYAISYTNVWWNWFNSIFFFKFTSVLALTVLLADIIKRRIRSHTHTESYILILVIIFLISYLLYMNAMVLLFGYFTQVDSFRSSGWSDSSRIIHGPLKWGWGSDARDHFSYHKTPTTLWYKNDPLLASSMLLLNLLLFKFLFFFFLQIITIARLLKTSGELSTNNVTYFALNLKQFLNFILGLNLLVVASMTYQYLRLPSELYWFESYTSLSYAFIEVIEDFLMLFI